MRLTAAVDRHAILAMIACALAVLAAAGLVALSAARRFATYSARTVTSHAHSQGVIVHVWNFGAWRWLESAWWVVVWAPYLLLWSPHGGVSACLGLLLSVPLHMEWVIVHSRTLGDWRVRAACIGVCLAGRYALVSLLHLVYAAIMVLVLRGPSLPPLLVVCDRMAAHFLLLHYGVTTRFLRHWLDRHVLNACLHYGHDPLTDSGHPLQHQPELTLCGRNGKDRFLYRLVQDTPHGPRVPLVLTRRPGTRLELDLYIPSDGYSPRLLTLSDPEAGGDTHRRLLDWFSEL